MRLAELIKKNRSYRRFKEEMEINRETLLELIDLARFSASAANLQPLKFLPACERGLNELIFPCLGWAGYLKNWAGPISGERPAAYIIILSDRRISEVSGCDHGIAAQSILLGAVERGLGGCLIGSLKRQQLRERLSLPLHLDILLVVALGHPAESVQLEELPAPGRIEYWRDETGVHHVPKRSLHEIVVEPPSDICTPTGNQKGKTT